MNNMFEKASRMRLRFTTGRGNATVEDLWELSPAALNTMAIAVNKELREQSEESFLPVASNTKSKQQRELELKLEILKHVINTRHEEEQERKERHQRRQELEQQRERLQQILANKVNESLSGESLENINKMLRDVELQLGASN